MNLQARSFGISLLLHAGALLIVFTLSGAAAPAGSTRIIDLRILQPSGSADASLPARTASTPRLPPRQRDRKVAAPAVKPRPLAAPRIEEPPPLAVPSPVAPSPVAPTAPVRATEPAGATTAPSEASPPEAADLASTTAAVAGDRAWSEAEGSPTAVAPDAAATAVAPGEETSSTASAEGIVQQSSVPPGDEQGPPPRDFSSLREIVQRYLVYPNVARRRGWEGKVTLSFIVAANGQAREIAVLESSGRELLDRHAVDTVKKISCFPAAVAEARIIIPVVYRLN